MTITAADVNKLRKQTGAGLMDCKKALVETQGDFEAAIDYLRKKGQKVSEKRSDRETNEGVVIAASSSDGKFGVVINLGCETDFVAKNEEFIQFAKDITELALTKRPSDKAALLSLSLNGVVLSERLVEQIGKIGEKIEVGYNRLEGEAVIPYIHAGYKIGVLTSYNKGMSDKLEVAGKDISMQVAAMAPIAVDADDVDEAIQQKEMEIGREQARAEGKPEKILDKIAAGKLNKFFKDKTLMNQQFVKDSSMTIKEFLKSVDPELKVNSFVRVALGE